MLARLKELLLRIRPPRVGSVVRGPLFGVVAVLVFCAGLLFISFKESDRYYETHLVGADTSYYMMSATLLVSGKDDFKLRRVLGHPAPLPSSDNGTTVYVLQTLTAWYLRAYLPLRPAIAVLLNGVWFTGMALSVYALFWSRIGKWSTAAIVTIAYSVANPFLPTITYGITSMDPNLVGFMLGTCALCWTALSERFTRIIPCVLVGLSLGLLCLGRIYTLGIVGPAMLPWIVACFWRRSWRDMFTSVQGGVLALGVAYAVSGWFLRANWQVLLKYPTQYGSQGVLAHMAWMDGIWHWLRFPKMALAQNLTFVCVLSWPIAMSVIERRPLRDFNWSALWAALIPLLVLAKMGTSFEPYGAACLFGVYLVLLLPFAKPYAPMLYSGRFAAVLCMGCAFSGWGYFKELRNTHDSSSNNKRSTLAALELMRRDAAASGRKRVTLGLVHWATLHDAALVNALIQDMGMRVATPDFQPKRRSTNPLIVDPLLADPWLWDAKVVGAAAITPASWADRMINEADYVFVLAGDRRQDRREGRWPAWVEASELITQSQVFRRLGPPFWVSSDGTVELLVRKKPRSG